MSDEFLQLNNAVKAVVGFEAFLRYLLEDIFLSVTIPGINFGEGFIRIIFSLGRTWYMFNTFLERI